jgi:hypothetical protein
LAAYSAHDVSLASLMVVLGLETNGLRADGYPHCAATVMLELWKSGEGFFVKVIFCDNFRDAINFKKYF